MIKSRKLLLCGSILTVAFFVATFFTPIAMAIDDTTTNMTTAESIEAEAAELDVKVPGNFFFLRQWQYNIKKAFTFNPLKKAEIELKQASEQLIRARQISINSTDVDIEAKISDALVKYEEKITQIQKRAETFKEKAPEMVTAFIDKLSDRQLTQQEVMAKLQEKMSADTRDKIIKIKDKSLKLYSKTMDGAIDNKEKIAEHVLKAMDKQNEKDFNRLKHIEILKNLEGKVPEQAIAAIQRAQENVLDKFKVETENLPTELKELSFHNYIEKARDGSESRLDVLEIIKERNIMPTAVINSFNLIKNENQLKIEALKKGFENLSEVEKKSLEQAQEKAQVYINDKGDRFEQIRTRLESNNVDLPDMQKRTLEQFRKSYEMKPTNDPADQIINANLPIANPVDVDEDVAIDNTTPQSQPLPPTIRNGNRPSHCPEWVNCMPGPGTNNDCKIPPGCEEYTQKAY
jgi:hypothetical protein